MKTILCTLAILAATAFGAEISGKWSGPMEMTRGGETKADSAYLILKQEGTAITGSVGPTAEKQMQITAGTIEGDAINISADMPENRGKVVLKLKLTGDKLKGELTAGGGDAEGFTGKMELSKVE